MKNTITLFTALWLLITTATAQVVDVVTGLNGPTSVALSGNTLYITEVSGNKISKIDISIPNPIASDVATGIIGPWSCAISGNDLYIAEQTANKLVKIDVTQQNPLATDVLTGIGNLQGLHASGNNLFMGLNGPSAGIQKLDISQPLPQTPTVLYSNNVNAVVENGDLLYFTDYIGGGIYKLDQTESNPLPSLLSTVGGGPVGLTINGQFLYITGYDNGKVIRLDLNEANPTPVDVVTGLNQPTFCAFDGIEMYIAERGANKIVKLEITQPTMSNLGIVCAGSTTTLGGASPTGGVYSGTGVTDNGNGETFTFDASVAGVGTTTVTYTAAGGSGLTATADVTIIPAVGASFGQTVNELTASFADASTGSANSWTWEFGDGNTSTDQNPIHTYTSEGVYTVCLTAGNDCSFNTACMSVTVTAPCVVNIPDANFKSYLVGNSAINTNNDSEIQCSEAEAFNGNISCPGLSISNLDGIEAFVNLTELNCGGNQITSLDLSQNTLLSHLGCELNQISSLDVSQNTALTSLNLHTNNVASLDLSLNIALTELYCANNQLTGLDVSQNTALETINCQQNQLTGLDVSQNTALVTLYCHENQLSGLDVSFNPELINFACNDNQLTSLNVANGNNTNFTLLHANNNSALTCVEVDDAAYSTANWPGGEFWFDAVVTFSEDCNPTPADNDCAGANDINSLFGGAVNTAMVSTLYDNTDYTSEGDPATGFECHYQGDPLESTIWYTFTGDGNTYRIRSVECSATNYIENGDTQVSIYEGNDCNNLTDVACNDDEDGGAGILNIQVDLETTNGTMYYMLIDGYDGHNGEFCLEVTRIDPSGIFEDDYKAIDLYPNPTQGLVSWNGINAQTAEVYDNAGRMVMSIAQPNGAMDIGSLTEGIYVLKLFTEDGAYTSRVVKH